MCPIHCKAFAGIGTVRPAYNVNPASWVAVEYSVETIAILREKGSRFAIVVQYNFWWHLCVIPLPLIEKKTLRRASLLLLT